MVVYREIVVRTSKRREIINITRYLDDIVKESGVSEGVAVVFLPHATAAIIANEDEPLLSEDLYNFFEKLAPEKEDYEHNRIDNNADAHLLSSLFKQFYIFPIHDGKLVKGTWQELLLAEFDGPRTRRVVIVILGNKR
jgi:secondary thiamine-phosphate synthase enzyme